MVHEKSILKLCANTCTGLYISKFCLYYPYLLKFNSCKLYFGGRKGMNMGYWWESQKETDRLEDQDVGRWVGR
jgi:hypothetical protein